jgi:quercetin dioxygenase-like cupin family protein
MKTMWRPVMLVVVGMGFSALGVQRIGTTETNEAAPAVFPGGHTEDSGAVHPVFTSYEDFKWGKVLPELGDASPEICILHVDPKTQATKLMIRTPVGIHVRKHWHSANETHTIIVGKAEMACGDGKRMELGPGSFNFMPAKMVHEAWLPAGSLTFITVDSAWDIHWVDGAPTADDLSK